MTTRGDTTIEERRVEQQVSKTTRCSKATSSDRANSQQVPQSRAESTYLAVLNSKTMDTKAEPSKPYNEMVSSLPPRFVATQGSEEKEQTGGAPKPMCNMFDRLGQNAEKDLCVHLDARRTSASSKKNDVPTFSLMYDEINELRKWLDKLVAKSSETTPSITSSPFCWA